MVAALLGLTARPKRAKRINMRLSQYLSLAGLSAAKFAAGAGLSQRAVAHWARGDRTPRPEQMKKIVTLTSGAVTPNDFFAPPQVPNETAAE